MDKRWFLALVAAFILAVGGSVAPAFAGAAKEVSPEQRIEAQQKRIDQALKANEVTPDDAKMLQGGLDKVKEEMTRMKADGQLSKEEKDKLDSMLDQNGQLIIRRGKRKRRPLRLRPKLQRRSLRRNLLRQPQRRRQNPPLQNLPAQVRLPHRQNRRPLQPLPRQRPSLLRPLLHRRPSLQPRRIRPSRRPSPTSRTRSARASNQSS